MWGLLSSIGDCAASSAAPHEYDVARGGAHQATPPLRHRRGAPRVADLQAIWHTPELIKPSGRPVRACRMSRGLILTERMAKSLSAHHSIGQQRHAITCLSDGNRMKESRGPSRPVKERRTDSQVRQKTKVSPPHPMTPVFRTLCVCVYLHSPALASRMLRGHDFRRLFCSSSCSPDALVQLCNGIAVPCACRAGTLAHPDKVAHFRLWGTRIGSLERTCA